MQASQATCASASRSAARLVTCRPRASMPGAHRETIATRAATRRITGNSAARPSAVCCFESFSRPSALTSARVSRSRSNSTAAATSGPASEPRPASSAPATYRAPNERSNANNRLPLRTGLEEADPVRRPVGEECDPDEPFTWDGTPEPAVVRLATVVPHHEVIPGRNHDRLAEIAGLSTRTLRDVGVLLLHAVADHMPVDDRHPVTRAGHHPLDERGVGLLRRRLAARLRVSVALI